MKDAGGHWAEIARRWSQVGPPLRPSAEDVEVYSRIVKKFDSPRALICGVTPELYRLPWPAGSDVLAVDHTRGMIEAVWPGPRDAVICGDWTKLPLGEASRDVVLCDGGVHLLSHPPAQAEFAASLRHVLRVGGACVLRLFVPPEVRESPEVVLAEKITNHNVLKLRLLMSLQDDATRGVELHHVWQTLHNAGRDAGAVSSYRDCHSRYHFVTLNYVRQLFEKNGFALDEVHAPPYELGERCPLVVLRRIEGKSSA